MRKRILLLLAIVLTSLTASAYDFEVDGFYYNVLSEDELTCEVTYKEYLGNPYSGDVVIPSAVAYDGKNYSVTKIGVNAFNYCEELISVVIPNSVTAIDEMAFQSCYKLASVVIPNSVTTIGDEAFIACNNLESVEIPSSVSEIGTNPFAFCSYLSELTVAGGDNFFVDSDCLVSKEGKLITGLNKYSVVIPNSVTEIGKNAFRGCYRLASVEIPSSVSKISSNPFTSCNYLSKLTVSGGDNFFVENDCLISKDGILVAGLNKSSVVIPYSVTAIGGYAFSGSTKLESVVIPNTVTEIGEYAFNSCLSLSSVEIPNSVTVIGDYAFSSCSNLTTVVIPNSVTTICAYAFSYCSKLASVEIPNSVTSIGEAAFWTCSSLTSVEIPSSVTEMGLNPFLFCRNLSTITVAGGDNFFVENDCLISKEGILVTGLYKSSIEIPNSVTTIGGHAFHNCWDLTSVVIPNSVTAIDRWAFQSCLKLTSVEIPASVTTIGEAAFSNCTALEEIISRNTTPPSCESGVFEYIKKDVCVLKVPTASVDTYKIADYWKEFFNIVGIDDQAGVNSIAKDASCGKTYDINGAIVDEYYKGIVIRDGKKFIQVVK